MRNGPVIANLVTPKYFKFYQVGTLRNDETDLLVEEKLDEFLRISESKDKKPVHEKIA